MTRVGAPLTRRRKTQGGNALCVDGLAIAGVILGRCGDRFCHAPRVGGYRYSTLTRALDDASSPLRAYLWERFPYRRELQDAYRLDVGSMRVPRSYANLGTLGTAFDQAVAYAMNPSHRPTAAGWVARDPQTRAVIDQLRASAGVVNRNSPMTVEAARSLWALALCIEVYRMGAPYPGSPIDEALDDDDFTADRLLSAASDQAVDDLRALHAVALDDLYPHLPATRREAEVHTEVTFGASSMCKADADLVIDGLLLEVKTRLGRKTPSGHADTLLAIDLYQALAYLLFDLDDRYKLQQLGWYSARYGNLAVFDVGRLLHTMANSPHVDLAEERAHLRELLVH